MHTITNLAKNGGLPRRTLQYWHDKEVIRPLSQSPVVYSDDELILVRIMAALTQSKPTITWISELADVLRLCIKGDESVPGGVARAFEAASQGKVAFLGITPSLMSDGTSIWPHTFGAIGEPRLQLAIVESLNRHPNLALSLVDLKYCFDLKIHVGNVFMAS